MDQVEADIAEWRAAVLRDSAVDSADADELEEHLREQLDELSDAGLTQPEAFQIAVQRLGRVDRLTAEFAREHGERLWKQLAPAAPVSPAERSHSVLGMIVFAGVAAIAIQVGRLCAGIRDSGMPTSGPPNWFLVDAGLFVIPVLIAYFVWSRRMPRRILLGLAAVVVVAALIVNLYPFAPDGQTLVQVAIHFPVLLWFAVGAAYLSDADATWRRRMEFVRFTGEWVIYWVLLALGGGVLMGLTTLILQPIAPDAIGEVMIWVLPSGAAAATIVAAWLVEAKKSVIENIAPVLAAVFTPLFAAMLIVAVVVYATGGIGRDFDRDLVTVFDLLMIVVFGLVLYALSARDRGRPAGILDVMWLVAIVAALILDLLVLVSMLTRVGEFGLTPNRVAALGLNLILVVNLVVTAWISIRMIAGRAAVHRLERWQTGFLPVFVVWVAVVVVVVPPLFDFS
jgi:hypothetical protein